MFGADSFHSTMLVYKSKSRCDLTQKDLHHKTRFAFGCVYEESVLSMCTSGEREPCPQQQQAPVYPQVQYFQSSWSEGYVSHYGGRDASQPPVLESVS